MSFAYYLVMNKLFLSRFLPLAIAIVSLIPTQVFAEKGGDRSSNIKGKLSIAGKDHLSETPQVLKDLVFDYLGNEDLATAKSVSHDMEKSAQKIQDERRVRLSTLNLPELQGSLLGAESYELAKHRNLDNNYHPTMEDARLKAEARVLSVTQALGTTLVDFELAPTENQELKFVDSQYQPDAPLDERKAQVRKAEYDEPSIPFRVERTRHYSVYEQDNLMKLSGLLNAASIPLLGILASQTPSISSGACSLMFSSPATGTCSNVLSATLGLGNVATAVLVAAVLRSIFKKYGKRALIPKISEVMTVRDTSDKIVPHYMIKDIEMYAQSREHARKLQSIHSED